MLLRRYRKIGCCASGEGAGGGGLWIALALLYLFMLRASELFAENDGRIHEDYSFACAGGGVWRFSRTISSKKDGSECTRGVWRETKGEMLLCWLGREGGGNER